MSPSEMPDHARQRVLALLSEALDLIDAHGGPTEIAAYLEMALQGLRATRSPDAR